MPPRKTISTNAFGVGEIREEAIEEAENEGLAIKPTLEEDLAVVKAYNDRPVYRLLREKEEWVDKGLETAYKDGYTEIIGGISYHAPFFYVITKREV